MKRILIATLLAVVLQFSASAEQDQRSAMIQKCNLANYFADFLASYFANLGELNCNFPDNWVFRVRGLQNNSPSLAI